MQSTLLAFLGLHAAASGQQQQPGNYAPAFLIANWFYAYCALSTRFSKMAVGLDHNASPREDLSKYGDAAVSAGKLSRRRLAQIQRMEGAHQNSVDGFPFFVAAVLFATVAGVGSAKVNAICVWYTLSRLAYGAAYILIESEELSIVRSVVWWSCNASCITGLVLAARAL